MGYRLEQIQGKHHRMFCEREEAESAEYRAFWERLNRGDFVAARFKRIDALGRPVWLEASYNPVHDAYGKLYKVIKFATVITEQVQREMAVAEAATIAYSTSQQTDLSAQRGAQVVQQTVEVMHQIAQQMQDASDGIEALDKQSQLISAILKTISGIADQTNLLALNAAIEAARAGEQGRGFAVVADEVRKLAERTTQSTQEIASTILEMQAGAQAAVHGIHAVVERVDEGVSRAEQANEAIQEIGEGSRKTVDMVGDISDAIREQSMASTAIAQQVEKIAQMSEENSAAAQSTSDTAGELAHLAQEMQQVVAQYRL